MARKPGHRPFVPTRDERALPFTDLIYLVARSVSEAQETLDTSAVETAKRFAEQRVEVVDSLTQTIDENGDITVETDTVSRSLSELGFQPPRYQFSDATVEIEFDISTAEEIESESETETEGRYGLFADTSHLKQRRKFNREAEANARVTATMQSVPTPPRLAPEEKREHE